MSYADEVIFWLGFLAFNFLQFAPNYIIQYETTRLIPFSVKGIQQGNLGVFTSANADFFRLSLDVSLIIFLYRFDLLETGQILFAAVYCFFFLFNCYHFSFRYIYKSTPVILNDLKLLRDGFAILYNESKIRLLMYALGVFTIVVILLFAFHSFLMFSSGLTTSIFSLAMATCIFLYVVAGSIRKGLYQPIRDVNHRFIFFLTRIYMHILHSLRLHRQRIKLTEAISTYKTNKNPPALSVRPNIYLIFMESYGSFLMKEPEIKSQFKIMFSDFSTQLASNDWGMKSNLSESVSLIGPSWLAYSSFMYGCRIDSNLIYEHLMRNPAFIKKDSLMTFLKANGYRNFNLNPTKSNDTLKVPMEVLTSFYQVDQWILRKDIPYEGAEYGFGDFPPDQYTLNYAYEHYLKKHPEPFLLFFLTKNPHSPFISPVNIVEQWQTLNTLQRGKIIGRNFLKKPTIRDFMNATRYELKVMEQFILEKGTGNDIFLLIGDHQPHHISKREHGLETIVHIISKDKKFLKGFDQYGFRDSLYDAVVPVKHEGLPSAFYRELVRHYGKSGQKLPDYEPDGLVF